MRWCTKIDKYQVWMNSRSLSSAHLCKASLIFIFDVLSCEAASSAWKEWEKERRDLLEIFIVAKFCDLACRWKNSPQFLTRGSAASQTSSFGRWAPYVFVFGHRKRICPNIWNLFFSPVGQQRARHLRLAVNRIDFGLSKMSRKKR